MFLYSVSAREGRIIGRALALTQSYSVDVSIIQAAVGRAMRIEPSLLVLTVRPDRNVVSLSALSSRTFLSAREAKRQSPRSDPFLVQWTS